MAKTKKQVTKDVKHIPYVISPNHSIVPLRTNRDKTEENERFPLGRYTFPIAIVHGSRTENAYERVRQVTAGGGIYLNHPDSISNASNKLTSKRLFMEHGVPTTRFQEMREIYVKGRFEKKNITLEYPIVAKLISGSGGEGMSLLQTEQDLLAWRKKIKSEDLNKYFFEEVFNWRGSLVEHFKATREYRISCSPLLFGKACTYPELGVEHNGVIVALRKLMKNEAIENGAFGRNIALGHSHFVKTFKKDVVYEKRGVSMVWDEGVVHALNAVRALGLDYGAVDILWSSQTGEWCVIEVNTAPAMGNPEDGQTFTLSQWREGFKYMIAEKRNIQQENL